MVGDTVTANESYTPETDEFETLVESNTPNYNLTRNSQGWNFSGGAFEGGQDSWSNPDPQDGQTKVDFVAICDYSNVGGITGTFRQTFYPNTNHAPNGAFYRINGGDVVWLHGPNGGNNYDLYC